MPSRTDLIRQPVAALLGVVLLLWGGAARGQGSTTVEEVLARMETVVPVVTGRVVSVSDGTLFLDVPDAPALQSGVELVVLQEAGDIVHPLTRQVLGRFEKNVARAAVRESRDGYVTARIMEGRAGDVRPGDRIRISSSRLKLLLLATGPALPTPSGQLAVDRVNLAAERSLRFLLARSLSLPGSGPLTPEEIARQVRDAGADLALVAVIQGEDTLSLRLHAGLSGLPLAEFTLGSTPVAPPRSPQGDPP
jgi:hypothetical protein